LLVANVRDVALFPNPPLEVIQFINLNYMSLAEKVGFVFAIWLKYDGCKDLAGKISAHD
jgi:hypothetical protein